MIGWLWVIRSFTVDRHKPDHWSWRFCVSGCLLNRWIVFQILKFSNPQIFKPSIPKAFGTNSQIFKSSNPQSRKPSGQIFKSSNLQIFKSSNLQINIRTRNPKPETRNSNLQIINYAQQGLQIVCRLRRETFGVSSVERSVERTFILFFCLSPTGNWFLVACIFYWYTFPTGNNSL